jgi:voltage-gated potassium channel
LADLPVHALTDRVQIPSDAVSPARRITTRVIYALGALFAAVIIVYLDRHGYRDVESTPNADDPLSFLDCLYYATVSLSTTGYGDITPVTPSARLINVLVITPLRVAFLIVLIGTTVETLTTQSRQVYLIQRWRSKLRNHIVIIGYGTKGRTAATAMVGDDVAPGDIVVVDDNPAALDRAKSAGLVTVRGDATDSEVLRLASAQHARAIIVATSSDSSAVLVTLTARELAPKAKIIAAVREAENQHLLQQSGADSTVVTAETAGRLLGIAVGTPSVVEVMEDLLTPDAGFAIAERDVTPKEAGGSPRHLSDIVLGVVRDGKLIRIDDPQVDAVNVGDRLLYIKSADADR